MSNNRKPHVIVLRLAAVLLIMVMLSTSMMAGRYARYTTTATGSDSARVAKFSVTETTTLLTHDMPIKIIPGGTDTTTITVNNASEVAVRYKIDIKNPYGNLPLDFKIKVGETTSPIPYEGDIAPGQEVTYVLETSWTGSDHSISYSGKVDLIEISLSATQID